MQHINIYYGAKKGVAWREGCSCLYQQCQVQLQPHKFTKTQKIITLHEQKVLRTFYSQIKRHMTSAVTCTDSMTCTHYVTSPVTASTAFTCWHSEQSTAEHPKALCQRANAPYYCLPRLSLALCTQPVLVL